MPNLRITYDQSSDTAYLHLNDHAGEVGANRVCEEMGEPVETILDMDTAGRIVGIEFFKASERLPVRLLAESEPGPSSVS
jgi:uncharacterized protein YuzE